MVKSRFRLTRAFLSSLLISACGQTGPLYLPGTTPPFYVPPEERTDAESKQQPEQTKTDSQAKPSVPKTEPEQEKQPQEQSLDQPSSQP